ncbi:energy-coupling factor ABC transporter permease [Allonocardiopsis opalescens]|uniref:energy-coupling factor ABC transporter permease n=1 Tax=Allonocardiopsis opalescens TaxID=1144618 RepID=UPI001FE9A814|nr:energy-coupling factor ABC transporter permease [Allonocardiopsis opalescens]
MGPIALAAGAVAVGGVAVAVPRARRQLDERAAPMAGLVAAFVFAAQMLNFPVAGGTSGHLLGGALAAILVGPYAGLLAVAIVLLVQALVFADGGLTALGVNVTTMALVTVVVAYPLFRLLVRTLPVSRASVTAAAFVSALVSVPASALAFVLLFAVGGAVDIPLGTFTAAMGGVHVLIGIGEGLITAAAVAAVVAVRPDLVYGARGLDLRAAAPLRGGEAAGAA